MMKKLKNLIIVGLLFVTTIINAQIANAQFSKIISTEEVPLLEGSWEIIPEFTDEFKGGELNSNMWNNHDPKWVGRYPSYFAQNNVSVKDGKLHLKVREINSEDLDYLAQIEAAIQEVAKHKGEPYTHASSAVKSIEKVKYGYFEIKCKMMDARAFNSFWFYYATGKNVEAKDRHWTEIDVFEVVKSEKYSMSTAHMFKSPEFNGTEDYHVKFQQLNPLYKLTGYHVYGLDWNEDRITWFIDGVDIFSIKNDHWHEAMHMIFDTEINEKWPDSPDAASLPATFDIEYIRSWKRKGKNPITTNKIVSMKGPDTAKQGERITIPVEYEVKESQTVHTELHLGKDWYAGTSKEVAPGKGTVKLTYTVPDDLVVGDNYSYYGYITEVGGKWKKGVPSKSQRPIKIIASGDKIISVTAPDKLVQGQSVTVAVEYKATKNRKIVSILQLGEDPYASNWDGKYAVATKNVCAGSDTVNLTFTVPNNVPAGTNYQIQNFITSPDKDWYEGVPHLKKYPVEIVSSASSKKAKLNPKGSFIHPNPGSGLFNLNYSSAYKGEVTIKIFTVDGRQINEFKSQKEQTDFTQKVDLTNQASGVYIIKFKAGDYQNDHQIIKE